MTTNAQNGNKLKMIRNEQIDYDDDDDDCATVFHLYMKNQCVHSTPLTQKENHNDNKQRKTILVGEKKNNNNNFLYNHGHDTKLKVYKRKWKLNEECDLIGSEKVQQRHELYNNTAELHHQGTEQKMNTHIHIIFAGNSSKSSSANKSG